MRNVALVGTHRRPLIDASGKASSRVNGHLNSKMRAPDFDQNAFADLAIYVVVEIPMFGRAAYN